MFLYQAVKTANSAQKPTENQLRQMYPEFTERALKLVLDGKATVEKVTYTNSETGRASHRHLLKNSEGKYYDSRMGDKYGFMSQQDWKRRIGLGDKYEFSFAGKPETSVKEKPNPFIKENKLPKQEAQAKPKQAEKKPLPKTSAPEFFTSGKEAFHEKIKADPVHGMIKTHLKTGFSGYFGRITEKKPGEKSALELAYEYGKKYDVDPALVLAMIFGESAGEVNPKGGTSKGLMQLEPLTAKSITGQDGKKIIKSDADLLNKAKNIEAGVKYISDKIAAHPDDIATALYGYNGGSGNARKLKSSNYTRGDISANDYARKMLGAYKLFKEMGVENLMAGQKLSDFASTERYAAAIKECQSKADGGYLSNFNFSSKMRYDGNEFLGEASGRKISPER